VLLTLSDFVSRTYVKIILLKKKRRTLKWPHFKFVFDILTCWDGPAQLPLNTGHTKLFVENLLKIDVEGSLNHGAVGFNRNAIWFNNLEVLICIILWRDVGSSSILYWCTTSKSWCDFAWVRVLYKTSVSICWVSFKRESLIT
jgi:hypothetical protein